MSNIRSLRKAFPGTAWKVSFAEALMHLQPGVNPDAADEASDEAFMRLEHLDPSAAALAWVEGRRDLSSGINSAAVETQIGIRTALI